jgi:putative MATE family efflux protein
MLVVNGLNALIAWLLVNGHLGLPRMGVAGSAVGAAVGRTVGGILAIALLVRGRKGLRLSLRRLRPDPALIRRIVRIALPSGAENLLFRTAQMVFFRVVAGLGTAVIAAQQIALNATSIAFLPGFGFAVAATTLVGQSLGAKDPRRAERSTYASYLWGGGVMVVLGLFLLFFPGSFMHFFTDSTEVIELGIVPLRLIAVAQPFLAASMIFSGALRGAGDTRAPLWINASNLWLLRIPVATLLTQGLTVFFPTLATASLPLWLRDGLGWGLPGAWMALVADLSLRGVRMLLRFRAGRWKETKV